MPCRYWVVIFSTMLVDGTEIFIVDYHTGYLWVKQMKNQETDTVVQHFQGVCNKFGYPMEVVSDRGLQYTSSDFQ